jgi:apolipoprotein N-acyltransferase
MASWAAGRGRLSSASLGDRAWNSLGVFGPGGSIGQRYDKVHLVPFGEYIPRRSGLPTGSACAPLRRRWGRAIQRGGGAGVIDFGPGLGQGAAADLLRGDLSRVRSNSVPERADWMLQVTNDAWFGTLTGPFQHFAQARLRAIEQGLPLVRVANTGVTRGNRRAGPVVADPALLGQWAALDRPALPGACRPPPMPAGATGRSCCCWPVSPSSGAGRRP